MTVEEIQALVARELASFHYEPPPPGSGLLGRPWSVERVAAGVEALRTSLVTPRPVLLTVPAPPALQHRAHARRRLSSKPPVRTVVRSAWVVATVSDTLHVLYDPAVAEFALADLLPDGTAFDSNVRGDLVSTFLAA